MTRISAVLAMAWLAATAPAGAVQDERDGRRGDDIVISLVTMGPGQIYWERFAHNAIWVRDPGDGIDKLYNYGMFSFADEDFLPRFLRGHMRYWMEGRPVSDLRAYMARDRSVWVQDLNLTPDQRVALSDFLQWNDRPENRYYDYNYYWDNCSTKVRDALDRAVGGALRRQTDTVPSGTTYRFHTQRLTTTNIALFTGLLVGLGSPVDRPITVWEKMFLPMQLMEHVRDVTVRDANGNDVPLVASERALYVSSFEPEPPAPPRWTVGYLAVGVVIAATLLALGWLSHRGAWWRRAFLSAGFGWALVVGVTGMGLAALWLFTDHVTSYRNENLFVLTPLAAPLVALLPFLGARSRWVRQPAVWLSLLLGASAVAGVVLQVLPWFDQHNGEILALVALPNLALAVGVLRFLPEAAPGP